MILTSEKMVIEPGDSLEEFRGVEPVPVSIFKPMKEYTEYRQSQSVETKVNGVPYVFYAIGEQPEGAIPVYFGNSPKVLSYVKP